MEQIVSMPIEVESEKTILLGEEGMKIEADIPVIKYFCTEECKNEYYDNTRTNN